VLGGVDEPRRKFLRRVGWGEGMDINGQRLVGGRFGTHDAHEGEILVKKRNLKRKRAQLLQGQPGRRGTKERNLRIS